MVSAPADADDRRMTTEQTEPRTVPRRLRRRSDERVIAGVASGLGDYFNVDPLLIRIALVASIVFGGVGIFVYLAAWLLVPDESTGRSIAERVLGRAGLAGGLFGGVLVVVGAIVFLSILTNIAGSSDGVFGLGFALLVIAVGAILLRNRDSEVVAVTAEASSASSVETEQAPRVVVRRPPRPPSPLGWYEWDSWRSSQTSRRWLSRRRTTSGWRSASSVSVWWSAPGGAMRDG
jgi:phage shock protein PspC (stress-responsive transcriptional regulator)